MAMNSVQFSSQALGILGLLFLEFLTIYGQVLRCAEEWTQIDDSCFALFHSPDFFGFKCAEEWTQIDDSCFALFHSPDFFGFKSVYEARRMCNHYGADLASLESEEIHDELFQVVRLLPKDVRPYKVYIGLIDIEEEGHYHWLDGTNVSFTLWGQDEPNNIYNSNEDCVLLDSESRRWYKDGSAVWKDFPCCSRDQQVNAAFCERAIDSPGLPITLDDNTNPLAAACYSGRDECLSSPCTRGNCVDRFLDYFCICPTGLTGKKCEDELHCPAVPMWIDYNISTKDTAYRTVMNYSCADEDYKFPDEAPYKTAECNATGLWAPPFVECAIPEKEHKSINKRFTRPTEAVGSSAVGSIAIIFLVLEISFLVILDMDYFIREVATCRAKRKAAREQRALEGTGAGAAAAAGAGAEEADLKDVTLCCSQKSDGYRDTSSIEAQPSSSLCPHEEMENGMLDTKF